VKRGLHTQSKPLNNVLQIPSFWHGFGKQCEVGAFKRKKNVSLLFDHII